MNGAGSCSCWPSSVTPRSSIASRSADWTLAGARLISSASSTLVKIGPRLNAKVRVARSNTEVPRMSAGSRSGVNWTRPYSSASDLAIALASSVLPVPGTPSSSTWPWATRATAHSRMASSWPTTALVSCSRNRAKKSGAAKTVELIEPPCSLRCAAPAQLGHRIGDAVQSLGGLEQVFFAGRGTVKRALGRIQLLRHLRGALPQSLPETLTRLHGKSRVGGDRPLAGGGQHAKRHGAGAGPAQELADRDRPFGLRPRGLGAPRDQRSEAPPAQQQPDEDGHDQPKQCGPPRGQDPRLGCEVCRGQSVMELVEGHVFATGDQAENVCRQPAVVRLVEVAVGELERIGKHDDGAGTDPLHIGNDVRSGAQERNLVRARLERRREVAAVDLGHAFGHGTRRLHGGRRHRPLEALDAERVVQLGVAALAGVDEHASLANPDHRARSLIERVGRGRSEDEHHPVGRRLKRAGDLVGRMAERGREQPQGRGAVGGIAVGTVLGRVGALLSGEDDHEQPDQQQRADGPTANASHAASASGPRKLDATVAARSYVAASTSRPPYTAASKGRSSGRSEAGSGARWKISLTVSGLPSHVRSPARVAATPAHRARSAPTRSPLAARRSASAKKSAGARGPAGVRPANSPPKRPRVERKTTKPTSAMTTMPIP